MVDYVARPAQLSGCWSSWSEKDEESIIRTQMEYGPPKVRLRFTGVHRTAQASVLLEPALYDTFMNWYRVLCKKGLNPTNIVEPSGDEAVWRFTASPQTNWNDLNRRVVTISCTLERLPGWQWL